MFKNVAQFFVQSALSNCMKICTRTSPARLVPASFRARSILRKQFSHWASTSAGYCFVSDKISRAEFKRRFKESASELEMDAKGELVRQMTIAEARAAIEDGVATGGMIPKLETAIAAVEAGVEAVVILDGRRPHAMLVELFSEHGAGTLIRA